MQSNLVQLGVTQCVFSLGMNTSRSGVQLGWVSFLWCALSWLGYASCGVRATQTLTSHHHGSVSEWSLPSSVAHSEQALSHFHTPIDLKMLQEEEEESRKSNHIGSQGTDLTENLEELTVNKEPGLELRSKGNMMEHNQALQGLCLRSSDADTILKLCTHLKMLLIMQWWPCNALWCLL